MTAPAADERDAILAALREFVDRDVMPHASDLDHADELRRRWWRLLPSMRKPPVRGSA